MDFLDPKSEQRNRTLLFMGYCLVALAVGITTYILLALAHGYNLNGRGQIIQKGLLFVSSQPGGATISLNGNPYSAHTNTRMNVPAGAYSLQISKAGYRSWQRPVVVYGDDVQHFDYPFLFPVDLHSSPVEKLAAAPSLATQSLDQRWLILGETDHPGTFLEYDLSDPAKPVRSEIVLPSGSFTPGDGAQAWSPVEWASDNKHVLLLHTYESAGVPLREYVILDRDNPADSTNLTTLLGLGPSESASLYNGQTSQVYVYDTSAKSLRLVTVATKAEVSKLDGIVAFKPSGTDQLLYVTDRAPTGKEAATNTVSVVLQSGQRTITLRTLPAGASSYALGLAQYGGNWYAAVASNDSPVYVYKNPQSGAASTADTYPEPWRRLLLRSPTYLAFSANSQFLLAENGQDFDVYDLENLLQYRYQITQSLDGPQTHATWMDGDRLLYVSGGKLLVFDYDYRNQQVLMPASSNYLPFFASDYSYVYALTNGNGAATKPALTSTPLTVTKP